jgi:beta-aspartyl-peptidase (threonine type)
MLPSPSSSTAPREVIHEKFPMLDARGGLIAVDAKGNITAPFNTPGMFHGRIKADGTIRVAIFEE